MEGKRLRLEIHVMAEQELLARHHFSWTPALADEFEYKGGGEWHSVGTYLTTYPQDLESLKSLQRLTEEDLKEAGITEFYTDIVEFE